MHRGTRWRSTNKSVWGTYIYCVRLGLVMYVASDHQWIRLESGLESASQCIYSLFKLQTHVLSYGYEDQSDFRCRDYILCILFFIYVRLLASCIVRTVESVYRDRGSKNGIWIFTAYKLGGTHFALYDILINL